jgi:hypothetical protein
MQVRPVKGCSPGLVVTRRPPQVLPIDAAASWLVVAVEDPIIAPSALTHGLGEEEILHAYRNPVRVWDLGDGFTMIVGQNAAAIFLEVGHVEGATAVVIVHAVRGREKFLR